MEPQMQQPQPMTNEQPDLGTQFLNKVMPKLNDDEKVGLMGFAAQVGDVASKMARAKDVNVKEQQKAQRKQANVNALYNKGMPQVGA